MIQISTDQVYSGKGPHAENKYNKSILLTKFECEKKLSNFNAIV